jgi:hypothetical protein
MPDSTTPPLKRWATQRRPFVIRGPGSRLTKQQAQARRVTLIDLPAPYDVFNGERLWVGQPQEVCENAGQTTPPPEGCGVAGGEFVLTVWMAPLQCEPHYVDWSQYEQVHIYHEAVVPGGTYELQLINEGCTTTTETNYSPALSVATSAWGDPVKDCTTFPCGPPDGITGIVDVTAILDKWKNLQGGILKVRADLEGSPAGDHRIPGQAINITDVTYCLGAFLGETYPPPGFPAPSTPPLCP